MNPLRQLLGTTEFIDLVSFWEKSRFIEETFTLFLLFAPIIILLLMLVFRVSRKTINRIVSSWCILIVVCSFPIGAYFSYIFYPPLCGDISGVHCSGQDGIGVFFACLLSPFPLLIAMILVSAFHKLKNRENSDITKG